MQKVIGLDIGSYSIKAIEIVNTFKSYEIVKFYETVIPFLDGVPLDAVLPVCMEQLFRENDLQADRILTAMPGQFISSRIIPFNFSDPRKIEQSVMMELEDFVPFNMDDMIVNHQILGTLGGKTLTLAVMTRKTYLRNFLDNLGRIQIDPKLVDVDSLAFYNLSSHIQAEPGKCYALVDIGHEKTSVCIVRDGLLRMFRSINLGGRYITEFLSRDLEISFHDAQRAKHRVNRMLLADGQAEGLSGDDLRIAERMTLATNAIVKELGRTFYAFKTWDRDPLAGIYLSGGTTRASRFAEFIQEQLEIPAQKLSFDQETLKISDEVAKNMEIVPQSLAIGLRAVTTVKKHSQINLRKGEFAYVQNYESILRAATKVFRGMALVVGLLLVSYIFQHYFYSKEITNLHNQYKKEFLTVFPDQAKKFRSANVTFTKLRKDAEGILRNGINDKKNAVEQFVLLNKGSGALLLLEDISAQIPKEVPIDVTMYEYKTTLPGAGKLVFRAETDNFASQQKIMDALKKVKSLKDIEEKSSGAKPGSDGKVIEFTVHANYAGGAPDKA